MSELPRGIRARLPEPTQRAFRGALVIAIAAVVVAVVMAWRATPKVDEVGQPITRPSVAANSENDQYFDERYATSASEATDSRGTNATIFVHVTGLVANPGVVELAAGSRVVAALEASGGLKIGAKMGPINLARVLVDGEQIRFGPQSNSSKGSTTAAAGTIESESGVPPSLVINLNSASAVDLQSLPGIGPALAQRILDFRKKHSGFSRVEDLLEVAGIGPSRLKDIRPFVRV